MPNSFGTKTRRAERNGSTRLAKLWADVEAGRVAKIVVWRLDRLGRTASGLAKLFEELTARKVGLLSLRDSIDLETAYELEVRSELQRAGIQGNRILNSVLDKS